MAIFYRRRRSGRLPFFVLPLVLGLLAIFTTVVGGFITWVAIEIKFLNKGISSLQEAVLADYVMDFQLQRYENLQSSIRPFAVQKGAGDDLSYVIHENSSLTDKKQVEALEKWCLWAGPTKRYIASWRLKPFSELQKNKNETFLGRLNKEAYTMDLADLLNKDNPAINEPVWKDPARSTGPLWKVAEDFFKNLTKIQQGEVRGYEPNQLPHDVELPLVDWLHWDLGSPKDGGDRTDPTQSACGPWIERVEWEWEIRMEEKMGTTGPVFDYISVLTPVIVLRNPYDFPLEETIYHLDGQIGSVTFGNFERHEKDRWPQGDKLTFTGYSKKESAKLKFGPNEQMKWKLPSLEPKMTEQSSSRQGERLRITPSFNLPQFDKIRLRYEKGGEKFTLQWIKRPDSESDSEYQEDWHFEPKERSPMFEEWESGKEPLSLQGPAFFKSYFVPAGLLKPVPAKVPRTPCDFKSVRWAPLAPIGTGYFSPEIKGPSSTEHLSGAEKEWILSLNEALWDGTYSSAEGGNLERHSDKLWVKRPFWIGTTSVEEWQCFLEDLKIKLSKEEAKSWAEVWVNQVKRITSQDPLATISQCIHAEGRLLHENPTVHAAKGTLSTDKNFSDARFYPNPIWEQMPSSITFESFWEVAWQRLRTCPEHFTLSIQRLDDQGEERLIRKLDVRPAPKK